MTDYLTCLILSYFNSLTRLWILGAISWLIISKALPISTHIFLQFQSYDFKYFIKKLWIWGRTLIFSYKLSTNARIASKNSFFTLALLILSCRVVIISSWRTLITLESMISMSCFIIFAISEWFLKMCSIMFTYGYKFYGSWLLFRRVWIIT